MKMLEDSILSRCHVWMWNTYPDLRYCTWHVANERATSKLQGAILKGKGVVSGVPDYVVNAAGKTYYFEFKSEKGKLSENQIKCHESLKKQGFEVYVIRNEQEFKNVIHEIIGH